MVKKGINAKVFGHLLLNIPKHLMKIAIIAVVASFFAMLYIVVSGVSFQEMVMI